MGGINAVWYNAHRLGPNCRGRRMGQGAMVLLVNGDMAMRKQRAPRIDRHEGRSPRPMAENWRFHALIAEASGNRFVERSYLHLRTLSQRIANLAYSADCFISPEAHRAHMNMVLKDHVAIVVAIRKRKADTAEALGRSHAQLGRKRTTDVLLRGLRGDLDIRVTP